MIDELACELAFDRVAAHLVEPSAAAPSPQRVREVIRRAEGFATLAPRVRAEVQRQALGWLERFPAVLSARRAVPSRATYVPLRRALEAAAIEAFGSSWLALATWCAGVPQSASEAGTDPPSAGAPSTAAPVSVDAAVDASVDASVDISRPPSKDSSKASSKGSSMHLPMHLSMPSSMHSSTQAPMRLPAPPSTCLPTRSSIHSSMDLSKSSSMNLSKSSSEQAPSDLGPAPSDTPLEDWLGRLWPTAKWPLPLVERTAQRPRTWRRAGALVVEVRAEPSTPQGAFELAHELGHAAAALAYPLPLPRAIDEAVAALVARQLEEHPACAATQRATQRALRARRHELAQQLACIEADLACLEELAGSSLPWALWHDPGAQRAYLRAEELASAWWAQGLRWQPPWPHACAALTAAVAGAVDEARALPVPWP